MGSTSEINAVTKFHRHTSQEDFQLLNISSLPCECDNISVIFFESNLFLPVNFDRVIVGCLLHLRDL